MNLFRVAVTLDENIVRVCRQFGETMVRWYDSPEGRASSSRSRSGDWGAETDPIRQTQGKAGEYAVALFLGLDPATAIKRSFGRADAGSDLTTGSLAIDVKTTPKWKRYLIWSRELNDLYWDKKFNVLVGVSIDEDDLSQCWIDGWISKRDFFERKKIADGVNDEGRLTLGTWFIEKTELSAIDGLLAESRKGFVGYDDAGRFLHYCHCGAWADYGFNVSLRADKLGQWFCKQHQPTPKASPLPSR